MADEWVCNYDGRDEWTDDTRYPTKEAAIAGGKASAAEWGSETLEVGRIDPYHPAPPDASDIIEDLVEQACGECGSDIADGWLDWVPQAAQDELTDAVYDAVMGWLKKHDLMPRFFLVREVEAVPLTDQTAAGSAG